MLKVFISYASEDEEVVLTYWQRLRDAGFEPWISCRAVSPGAVWPRVIPDALKMSDVVLLFMSPRSVNKPGMVQLEMRQAMAKQQSAPEGQITVIPLVLEPCTVPGEVADLLQFVRLSDVGEWDRVIPQLEIAAQQRNVKIVSGSSHGPFRVKEGVIEDSWHGGSARFEYLTFESETHAEAAIELSDYFRGGARQSMIAARPLPWVANRRELRHDGSEWPEDEEQGAAVVVFANSAIVSVESSRWQYSSGAAHGNGVLITHNFLVTERVTEFTLESLFERQEEALQLISDSCRTALAQQHWEIWGSMPDEAASEWINSGTEPEWSNFQAFTMSDDGILIRFQSYQVAPYASGTPQVAISFFTLRDVVRSTGPVALARVE
ncbi:TIR domain-containing protein [Luteimonas galliterrae]|nr:TIR domain-containing protein [Luteimonas galliterrae]